MCESMCVEMGGDWRDGMGAGDRCSGTGWQGMEAGRAGRLQAVQAEQAGQARQAGQAVGFAIVHSLTYANHYIRMA